MTSEEDLQKIKDRITQWLTEEGYSISEQEEDNPGDINKFVLRIGKNGSTLFHVVKPKSSKDRIVVGRGLTLEDIDQIAYSRLYDDIKRKFVHELMSGLILMKVITAFDPPHPEQSIKTIRVMKAIYPDGLSKDRLFEIVNEVLLAYAFIMLKFGEFNISSRPFDPNLYI